MMIAFCSLMMMAALFMEFSAKKKANGYRIPKTRVNLMTMKQQCHYLVLLCLCVISGQITNIVIQVYYQKLGIDSVFNIWWVQHLLEMLLFHVVLNIWHFHNASTHLEQFNGLVAKQFPGQHLKLFQDGMNQMCRKLIFIKLGLLGDNFLASQSLGHKKTVQFRTVFI